MFNIYKRKWTTYIDIKGQIFAENLDLKFQIQSEIMFHVKLTKDVHDCHSPWVRWFKHLDKQKQAQECLFS